MSKQLIEIHIYKNCIALRVYYGGLQVGHQSYNISDSRKAEIEMYSWHLTNLIELDNKGIECTITAYSNAVEHHE